MHRDDWRVLVLHGLINRFGRNDLWDKSVGHLYEGAANRRYACKVQTHSNRSSVSHLILHETAIVMVLISSSRSIKVVKDSFFPVRDLASSDAGYEF